MSWKTILKEQATLDFEFEEPTEPKKLPIRDEKQTLLTDQPWKRKITKPSRNIGKPESGQREEGTADASDVLPPIRQLRAEMTKDPRGIYGDLADKISRLSVLARKEPRRQKALLGYIRKLIRQSNIVESKYR